MMKINMKLKAIEIILEGKDLWKTITAFEKTSLGREIRKKHELIVAKQEKNKIIAIYGELK